MVRIVIRCDRDTRVDFRHLCNQVDDEADYEDVIAGMVEYFEEDESRLATLQRVVNGPEFR